MEGDDEVMEFELDGGSPIGEVSERLDEALPPGIKLKSTEAVGPGRAGQVCEVTYVARPSKPDDASAQVAPEKLRELLNRDQVLVERTRKGRRKQVDIRPFILDLRRQNGGVLMRFKVGPFGTTRPEEILTELGFPSDHCHVLFRMARTRVVLSPPRS